MSLLTVVALLACRALADEVAFPLTVDYTLLAASLRYDLGLESGEAVLWGTADGCRSLAVRDVAVRRAEERVRFVARGRARLGVGILGFCFAPLGWDGSIATLGTPTVGRDWKLRFRDLDSSLLDASGKSSVVARRLWDLVKDRVEERLERFTVDLGPPVDEATALLRASVPTDRAAPVVKALQTLAPGPVRVEDEGVKVDVRVDLPPATPSVSVPEAPLDPVEIQRWQTAIESWDAFLVFVIKDLGLVDSDPEIRNELFDLLVTSRHALLVALAAPPTRGVDPVRELFLTSWDRLRTIVRHAAERGALGGHAARYAIFLAAGDALAALDAAGPSLGLEISADGLRRLARVLEPDLATDPLVYSDAPDPALRDLFRFHEPESGAPSGDGVPPPDAWWWLGPAVAHAEPSPPDAEWQAVARRLDRWVPDDGQLREYRDAVERLLVAVGNRERVANDVPDKMRGLYGDLVKAVAWQESCWRQFVSKGGSVTYLVSTTADIGIMQVNRRVWRGFFDLHKLEWDIAYNTGAGAEILAQLLTRFGAKEASVEAGNAARATYAAYNGGPNAYRRYRTRRVPRAQRAIDRAFWEKFQAMTAGQALDYVLCVEEWGRAPRVQLSIGRPGSTSKRSIRSRNARATSASPCRHASIASRPRASRV